MRVNLRLPDPMLSRPTELPLGSGFAYEVKFDGFRAIAATIDGLRVRSRRGWNRATGAQILRRARLTASCTKSQAFRRRSSPSITSTHSPETTRKSSWPRSPWYMPR